MKLLPLLALFAALLPMPAQEKIDEAPTDAVAARKVRSTEITWKDGGNSRFIYLTLDGKPVQVLLRTDAQGRLIFSTISRVEEVEGKPLLAEEVTAGKDAAPYTITTVWNKERAAWDKDYYDFRGQLIMTEHAASDSKQSSEFTAPSGKVMTSPQITEAWEHLLRPDTKWLEVQPME